MIMHLVVIMHFVVIMHLVVIKDSMPAPGQGLGRSRSLDGCTRLGSPGIFG